MGTSWRRAALAKAAEYSREIAQIDARTALEMQKTVWKRSHNRLLILLYRERIKYSFALREIEELLLLAARDADS